MATQHTTGVYQREDGYWEYRFTITVNGKKIPRRKSTDASGRKLKTKKDAIIAREEAMVALRQEKTEKPKIIRKTVKEVFEEFCQSGRKDRAYRTIQKQDSLWENHLRDRLQKKKSEQFCDCRPTKRCINVDSELIDSGLEVDCKIWRDDLVSFTGCMLYCSLRSMYHFFDVPLLPVFRPSQRRAEVECTTDVQRGHEKRPAPCGTDLSFGRLMPPI